MHILTRINLPPFRAILKSQKVVESSKNKREVKKLVEEAKLDMKQIKKSKHIEYYPNF